MPRSPSPNGRAVAAQNGRTHGLRAAHVVTDGEEAQEFETFRNALRDELGAMGVLETEIVDQLAVELWRLRRAHRIEAEGLVDGLSRGGGGVRVIHVETLLRYRTTAQNAVTRGLEQLGMLRSIQREKSESGDGGLEGGFSANLAQQIFGEVIKRHLDLHPDETKGEAWAKIVENDPLLAYFHETTSDLLEDRLEGSHSDCESEDDDRR